MTFKGLFPNFWDSAPPHFIGKKRITRALFGEISILRKQFQICPARMCFETPFHVTECFERAAQLTVGVASFTPTLKANHSIESDLFQLPKQCEIIQFAFIQRLNRRNVSKTMRIPTAARDVCLFQIWRHCFQRTGKVCPIDSIPVKALD
jgi:hypothetical protein